MFTELVVSSFSVSTTPGIDLEFALNLSIRSGLDLLGELYIAWLGTWLYLS